MLAAFVVFPSPVSATQSYPALELANGGVYYSLGGTSTTVDLPSAGGIETGDLLVAGFCEYGPFGDVSMPSPWEDFEDSVAYPSGTARLHMWYRIAQAGMSPTVTVTFPGGAVFSYETFRLVGHKQTISPSHAPQSTEDHTISNTSASPNPPSLTSAFGTKPYLWMAIACAERDFNEIFITDSPAGFTDIREDTNDLTASEYLDMRSAYKLANVATLNPGAFNSSASSKWAVVTAAIEPQDALPLVTLPATKVYDTVARLNGRLDVLFSSTVLLGFEYGTTLSLGNWTSNLTKSSTGTYQIIVSGLSANTKYYFRAVSLEVPSGYAGQGGILNFTTAEPVLPDMIGLFAFAGFLAFTVGGSAAISVWVLGRKRKGGGI
jgi:hypothetical protein